jgi:predicted nucleic acid-binding protein
VFLRSADCLHLVTALRHSFDEIYTYDIRQSDAAGVLGLKPLAVGR